MTAQAVTTHAHGHRIRFLLCSGVLQVAMARCKFGLRWDCVLSMS